MAQQLHYPATALKLRARLARVGRYGVSGIVCAAATNGIIIAGSAFGLHYLPTMLLSFVLVGALGYVLHAKCTFGRELSISAFFSFMCGLSLGFLVSLLLMFLLCDLLLVPVWLATPTATLLLFMFNYVMARWTIAGRKSETPGR